MIEFKSRLTQILNVSFSQSLCNEFSLERGDFFNLLLVCLFLAYELAASPFFIFKKKNSIYLHGWANFFTVFIL